jgi:hypothetical protein
MSGWLLAQGSNGALAALLVAGHAVGDFVLQTRGMVARKHEPSRLLFHAAAVVAVQTLFLIPFLSPGALAVLLGLGVLHAAIDRTKLVLQGRRESPLPLFVADQLAHLCVLAGAWLLLRGAPGAWLAAPDPEMTRRLTLIAVLISAYAWIGNGAAALIAGLLRSFPLPPPAATDGGVTASDATPDGATPDGATPDGATAVDATAVDATAGDVTAGRRVACGRMIGILERMLTLTLVLIGQWGALGFVMAAKSIARFRDLEQREFSEYYLIGTLASILVAAASGLLVKFLVG